MCAIRKVDKPRAAAIAIPMTGEEWAEAPRVAQVKTIRRALKLSQEEYAASFHSPIGRVGIGRKGARRRTRLHRALRKTSTQRWRHSTAPKFQKFARNGGEARVEEIITQVEAIGGARYHPGLAPD